VKRTRLALDSDPRCPYCDRRMTHREACEGACEACAYALALDQGDADG